MNRTRTQALAATLAAVLLSPLAAVTVYAQQTTTPTPSTTMPGTTSAPKTRAKRRTSKMGAATTPSPAEGTTMRNPSAAPTAPAADPVNPSASPEPPTPTTQGPPPPPTTPPVNTPQPPQ